MADLCTCCGATSSSCPSGRLISRGGWALSLSIIIWANKMIHQPTVKYGQDRSTELVITINGNSPSNMQIHVNFVPCSLNSTSPHSYPFQQHIPTLLPICYHAVIPTFLPICLMARKETYIMLIMTYPSAKLPLSRVKTLQAKHRYNKFLCLQKPCYNIVMQS